MIQEAIRHYKYGISHDIFKEPVTTYAELSIDALEKLPLYEQIKWERDVAISQLEDIGCGLGRKMDDIKVAIEKQNKKTPILSGDGYWNGELVYDTWECPNCGKHYEVDYDDYDYCPNCGQAINKSVFSMEEGGTSD